MKKNKIKIRICVATKHDAHFAPKISEEIAKNLNQNKTFKTELTPDFFVQIIKEGKAVIGYTQDWEWVCFCYIKDLKCDKMVCNSEIIVNPVYKNQGITRRIKIKIAELSQKIYANSEISI